MVSPSSLQMLYPTRAEKRDTHTYTERLSNSRIWPRSIAEIISNFMHQCINKEKIQLNIFSDIMLINNVNIYEMKCFSLVS